MADAAAFPIKDALALARIAAFLEKLRRYEVTNQAAHLLDVERRLVLPGAEGVVPHGGGEVGKAVAGGVRFKCQRSAVASGAALGHEQRPAGLRRCWRECGRVVFPPRVSQPDDEIGEFLRGEQWIREFRPVERARHVAGMVPHPLGEGDRVPERFPCGDRPDTRADGRLDAVTLPAALCMKELLSALAVAERFEIAYRIEEDEQVGALLLIQGGPYYALLRHCAPHHRSMVPHQGGHVVGAEASLAALTKIGRLVPAHPIHAVTDDAVEALEQGLAAFGIAEQESPGRASSRGKCGDDEEQTRGSHDMLEFRITKKEALALADYGGKTVTARTPTGIRAVIIELAGASGARRARPGSLAPARRSGRLPVRPWMWAECVRYRCRTSKRRKGSTYPRTY